MFVSVLLTISDVIYAKTRTSMCREYTLILHPFQLGNLILITILTSLLQSMLVLAYRRKRNNTSMACTQAIQREMKATRAVLALGSVKLFFVVPMAGLATVYQFVDLEQGMFLFYVYKMLLKFELVVMPIIVCCKSSRIRENMLPSWCIHDPNTLRFSQNDSPVYDITGHFQTTSGTLTFNRQIPLNVHPSTIRNPVDRNRGPTKKKRLTQFFGMSTVNNRSLNAGQSSIPMPREMLDTPGLIAPSFVYRHPSMSRDSQLTLSDSILSSSLYRTDSQPQLLALPSPGNSFDRSGSLGYHSFNSGPNNKQRKKSSLMNPRRVWLQSQDGRVSELPLPLVQKLSTCCEEVDYDQLDSMLQSALHENGTQNETSHFEMEADEQFETPFSMDNVSVERTSIRSVSTLETVTSITVNSPMVKKKSGHKNKNEHSRPHRDSMACTRNKLATTRDFGSPTEAWTPTNNRKIENADKSNATQKDSKGNEPSEEGKSQFSAENNNLVVEDLSPLAKDTSPVEKDICPAEKQYFKFVLHESEQEEREGCNDTFAESMSEPSVTHALVKDNTVELEVRLPGAALTPGQNSFSERRGSAFMFEEVSPNVEDSADLCKPGLIKNSISSLDSMSGPPVTRSLAHDNVSGVEARLPGAALTPGHNSLCERRGSAFMFEHRTQLPSSPISPISSASSTSAKSVDLGKVDSIKSKDEVKPLRKRQQSFKMLQGSGLNDTFP